MINGYSFYEIQTDDELIMILEKYAPKKSLNLC